jgi:hypothetical protein
MTNWNRRCPNKLVTRATYPYAPDKSLNTPIPFVLGDFRSPPLRIPWTSLYGFNKDVHEDAGGRGLMIPGIVVDRGGSASEKLKVLFAGHAVMSPFGDTSFQGVRGSLLNDAHPSGLYQGTVTSVNTATEAAILLANDPRSTGLAVFPVIPVGVDQTSTYANTAANPRNAIDVENETSYATMIQGSSGILSLILPEMSSHGAIIQVDGVIGYRTETQGGSGDAGIKFGIYDYANSSLIWGTWTGGSNGAASTVPTTAVISWPWYTAWDFTFIDTGPSQRHSVLQVQFNGGSGQKCYVYFVGLRVLYVPNDDLLSTRTQIVLASAFPPRVKSRLINPGDEFPSLFGMNLQGAPDDASGTYTGAGNALIQRTPDCMRWLLVNYGAANPTSDFELGATSFGSFVQERGYQTAEGKDFIHSLHGGESRRVSDWLRILAEDSLSSLWLDRFDNKWRLRRWKSPDDDVDYDLVLRAEHLQSLELDETSDTDVENALRIRYGLEPATGQYRWDTAINANGSDPGAPAPPGNEITFVIDSSNNQFVVSRGPTDYTTSLPSGSYADAPTMARVIHDAIKQGTGFANGDAGWFQFGWTYYVYADTVWRLTENRTLTGEKSCYFTIAAGAYTGDTLATAVQVGMRTAAVAAGFSYFKYTVTWNAATQKWTIKSDSTGSATFSLETNYDTGAPVTTSKHFGWCVMGWDTDYPNDSELVAGLQTATSTHAMPPGYFYCMTPWFQPMLIPWSGTAVGSYPKMEALGTMLGFNDVNGGGASGFSIGLVPKGSATASNATGSTDIYGDKAELILEAPSLRAYESAVDLRNRRFALKNVTRKLVRASSRALPDLQRNRIIGFDASCDALQPFAKYGSDGSWAGKKFRVLDVTQQLGGEWLTQVVGIDVGDSGFTVPSSGGEDMSQSQFEQYYLNTMTIPLGYDAWKRIAGTDTKYCKMVTAAGSFWPEITLQVGSPTSYTVGSCATHNFTVAGCATNGTTTLTTTGNFNTAGVVAGMMVTGTDIPAGTYVVTVNSNTSLTMSSAATGTHSGSTMTFSGLTTTGSFATSGVIAGEYITGTDIPAGTTVVAVASATSLSLSAAVTGTHSGLTMTFAGQGKNRFVYYGVNGFDNTRQAEPYPVSKSATWKWLTRGVWNVNAVIDMDFLKNGGSAETGKKAYGCVGIGDFGDDDALNTWPSGGPVVAAVHNNATSKYELWVSKGDWVHGQIIASSGTPAFAKPGQRIGVTWDPANKIATMVVDGVTVATCADPAVLPPTSPSTAWDGSGTSLPPRTGPFIYCATGSDASVDAWTWAHFYDPKCLISGW